MNIRKKYIFTNKKHSEKGILSTVLGVLSLASILLAVWLSFRNGGAADLKEGASCLLAMLYALAGVVLGALSRSEQDRFHLFSYVGIVLNLLALAAVSFVLYAGAYGL